MDDFLDTWGSQQFSARYNRETIGKCNLRYGCRYHHGKARSTRHSCPERRSIHCNFDDFPDTESCPRLPESIRDTPEWAPSAWENVTRSSKRNDIRRLCCRCRLGSGRSRSDCRSNQCTSSWFLGSVSSPLSP